MLKVVDNGEPSPDLRSLGFEAGPLQCFDEAICKTAGLVLVTGPAGSGRTRTLYSSLARLNRPETKIITIEDVPELKLPGVSQVHTRPYAVEFGPAFTTAMRHNPDIVMLEELADAQVAGMAARAALDRLVLSTLPVYDAPSALVRLINMGVEPYLVATSVNVVCAQRLVRRICRECREEVGAPTDARLDLRGTSAGALVNLGFSPEEVKNLTVYKGKGCTACENIGYRGRVGLFEVMESSDEIRHLILEGASYSEIRDQAVREGMITLRADGLRKVADGVTTIAEVVRATDK